MPNATKPTVPSKNFFIVFFLQLVAFWSDPSSDSQKHFRRLKPEMQCRQRNTQFFKDGRKTAWWVKHIDLPKLFPRRAASLEARSLADVPVQVVGGEAEIPAQCEYFALWLKAALSSLESFPAALGKMLDIFADWCLPMISVLGGVVF
jgi:hypothetical protein